MKKLISNTGGMNTTTYEGAKYPEDERVHFELCLEPTDLANVKAAINEFAL